MEAPREDEDIDFELFPYQRKHVNTLERILRVRRAALDSSDTGTGKTFSGCVLARRLEMDIFVIGPKAVIDNWFDVGAMIGVNVLGVTNYESAKNGKFYKLASEFFAEERYECPYVQPVVDAEGNTDYAWNLPPNTLLIFDEGHRGKNCTTKTSKLMDSASKIFEPSADGTPSTCKILILSATITDSIDNFRVPAFLLELSQWGKHAYKAWLRSLKPARGESQAEHIHKLIFGTPGNPEPPTKCGSRMRIRDIQADEDEIVRTLFRGNDVRAQTYDMSPEVEAEIEAAYAEIDDALRELREKGRSDNILTRILRARQKIEMLKVPTMYMLAMEYVLQGHSVAIFVNFNASADALFARLDPFIQDEYHSFITFINGGQSPDDRRYNITSFRADKSRIMLANIRAGGVGLSLHDIHGNFPRVALISPTWSSIELKQVIGRMHRAGAKSNTIQRIIYCKGRTRNEVAGKLQEAVDAGKLHVGVVDVRAGVARDANREDIKKIEAQNADDTTFNCEGKGKVGVEELIAANVNKKMHTIEWLNNGDDDDLQLI